MRKVLFLLFLTSCGGDYTHRLKVPEDSIDVETYNHVIVQFEFINTIRSICEDITLISDYETETLYKQAVATCTLENLSIINIDALNEFDDNVCNNPETNEETEICNSIN